MTIKLVRREGEGELVFEGRLDSGNAGDADEILQQVADRYDTIVLNFENLQYISSAGLRVLKRLYMKLRQKDGILYLKGANSMVTEVLEMTGMIALFKVL